MTIIFRTKSASGDTFTATQEGDGHVRLELRVDSDALGAVLAAPQAVALATAILAVLPGYAMHHAENLDDELCAVLGQAFLLPAAKRSLARKAAAETPTPEAAN